MEESNTKNNEGTDSAVAIDTDNLFTKIYEITQSVFRHLPIRSVDSCSCVCQSWADQARLTKGKRNKIHALRYPLTSTVSSVNNSCLHLSDFDDFMIPYVNNKIWSLPYLALVVVTTNLDRKGFSALSNSPPPTKHARRCRSQATARQSERVDTSRALIRHLNKTCRVFVVASSGIVVSDDNNESHEIENEKGMGILLFPKFPSNVLGMYPFEIRRNTKIPRDISRSDLHRLLGCVPDNVSIRCVVFFVLRDESSTNICLEKLLEYYENNVVLIGGFADKVRYDDRQNQTSSSTYDACGIVLTGDSNHLTIQQLVLENDVNTREAVRNRLKQFKPIEVDSCLSFGLQVSCVARGSDFYNHEMDVECSEFRSQFPKTPLIGIFGNGELGYDYLPHSSQASQKQQQNTKDIVNDLYHTYSTVFSLISIRM